ncbi:cell division protein CrgA [Nonomuraea sp. CA-141351]|uniref:cell division protein CrgA n=1 Tax=Nonomuraea sp. CA-141351 TaxID=3239996 RepID=UPI003D8E13D0
MSPDPPDRSRSRAVLIGTAYYQDSSFPRLPAAANSLHGMYDILTDPSLGGWPADRVTMIEDPVDAPKLVQTLRRLARDVEDVLLLYFVGHGTILPNGHLCLTLSDTDADDPDVTGLEYERVRRLLLDHPAHVRMVILDCCYAGRAITALSGSGVADYTDVRGAYTLTASDLTARVPPLDEQAFSLTAFTGELVDLVRTGIPGEASLLTLNTIYSHLRRRLHRKGLPAPNQRGTDTADRFGFVRNAATAPPDRSVHWIEVGPPGRVAGDSTKERIPAQEEPAEVGRPQRKDPASRHVTVSPQPGRRLRFWLGTLMGIIGIVWAAIYYLAPGEAPFAVLGNLNLLVGFVLVVLGLSLAVRRPSG